MAEQVIIEFISDTSQLTPAIDQLEKMEKVEKSSATQFKATNSELQKQVKTLGDINEASNKIASGSQPLKKTLVDISSAVKGMGGLFIRELKQGAKNALDEAGVSLKDFEKALNKAVKSEDSLTSATNALIPTTDNLTTSEVTLKKELADVVKQLTKMKLSGQENTAQYQELITKAGSLKKAINDVNQEIKVTASSTSALDGLISATTGIAGGFTLAQGAVALFGDENQDLQKTLVRVNGTMAILQGLQSIQNVLQKESAASILANTIATKAQTIAQSVYNLVVGSSIGLMKVFRIAMAATGIGILVIGVLALVDALKSQNKQLEDATELIEREKAAIESLNEVISQRVSLEEARANAAEAAESELIRIRALGVQSQRDALIESNRMLAQQRDQLKSTSEEWFELNKAIDANNDTIQGFNNQILIANVNLEKQLADERKEALKKRIDAAKKEAEEAARRAKERRAAEFEDFKAGIEVRLLAAKEGSEEELDLRKQLLRATLQIELDNDKLTLNQRRLLIQGFFKERLDAEKKFAADREKIILENIASDINAELQLLDVTNERKLELTETAINLAAEIELNAAVGNASKITEINAKRDKAIRDARISSLQEVANYEIALAEATNGPEKRRLQQTQDNANEELGVRLDAIRRITEIESSGIQRRIELLNEEKAKKLITQKDYDLQYATLVDQQFQVFENAEKKKSDLIKSTTELARQQAIELTQTILDAAAQVVGVLDALFQLQSDKENESLNRQKAQLAELREAGAITEKEALTRQKRIEAEERRVRREQAEREKRIAVFNAGLAVPQAVLKGLTTGGPILAAIYGSLALAQLLITASRPIPKFGKGKKNKYEGPAEIGETGPELVQTDKGMYLAGKRQAVWLGRDDKVFNPQETMAMLSKPGINTERIILKKNGNESLSIDYEKLGKSVGKHVKTDVYVDGVHAQHIEQKIFEQYIDSRRRFGK